MNARYQVHQVDKRGTVLKTRSFRSKSEAVASFRFLAASLRAGILMEPKAVEVCLYDERIGAMLLSTAQESER